MKKLRTEQEIMQNWHQQVQPLVSICCLAYNHDKYLEEAIEGFLIQETEFPFEIIIHDDASIDKTLDIIEKYKTYYPKILKYIKQEENQYSKSPVMGPKHLWPIAKGEFIALCEGDDYWTDSLKLQKQIDILMRNTSLSACAHQSKILRGKEYCGNFKELVPKQVKTQDLLRGRLFHTASFVFRKSILDNGLAWPIVISGDRLLFLVASIKGSIQFIEENMCVYRIHGAGASSNTPVNRILLDLNSIKYLKSLMNNFPAFEYKSYIYATAALSKSATLNEKVKYFALFFIYSFSYFPRNIVIQYKFINKIFN